MKLSKSSNWLALALGLIFAGGCATSNRTNTSNKPWDRPLQNDRPGYDAPAAPGETGDRDVKP